MPLASPSFALDAAAALARAREEAVERLLDTIGFSSPLSLIRTFRRAITVAAPEADDRTAILALLRQQDDLPSAAEAQLAELRDGLLALLDAQVLDLGVLRRELDLEILTKHLQAGHQEAAEVARKARDKADRAAPLGGEEVPSGIFGRLFGRPVRRRGIDDLFVTIDKLGNAARVRKTLAYAAAADAVTTTYAQALQRVQRLDEEGASLHACITRARELLMAEATPPRRPAAWPDDLPPGYEAVLARQHAAEPDELARRRGLGALLTARTAAAADSCPLTPESLAARVRADAAPLAEVAPRTLEEALATVARGYPGGDARRLWRGVLRHLAGPALEGAPAATLAASAARTGYTLPFQVVPSGQPLPVRGTERELHEARYQVGLTAKVAFASVHTGFALEEVRAVAEALPELEREVARANPYLLGPLARPGGGQPAADDGAAPPAPRPNQAGPWAGVVELAALEMLQPEDHQGEPCNHCGATLVDGGQLIGMSDGQTQHVCGTCATELGGAGADMMPASGGRVDGHLPPARHLR